MYAAKLVFMFVEGFSCSEVCRAVANGRPVCQPHIFKQTIGSPLLEISDELYLFVKSNPINQNLRRLS